MFKLLQMLFNLNFLKLGIVDADNKSAENEALEQLTELVEKSIEKSTEELQKSYEDKIKELKKDFDNSQEEISKLKTFINSSEANKKAFEDKLDEAVVKVFKNVNQMSSVSEKEFENVKAEVAKKTLAEGDLNTGTSKAGLNIFTKFEKDLIYEIKQYEIPKIFRNINLAKGTKITWTIATNGIVATFVDEKGMPTESEPKFDQISIDIKKIVALVSITQELEEDQMTTPQLYRLIVEFAGEAIAELLEKEALSGDGTGYLGIFNLPNAKEYSLAAGKTTKDITDDDILAIEQKLKPKDRAKANWFMTDYVRYQLLKVRDTNGNRMYPELRNSKPTLDGYPVRISAYAGDVKDGATDTAGKSFLAFGNPKKYLVVNRTGVSVAKGFYGDNWAKEIASIKVRKRGGMGSLDDSAFVIAKNGN